MLRSIRSHFLNSIRIYSYNLKFEFSKVLIFLEIHVNTLPGIYFRYDIAQKSYHINLRITFRNTVNR